ncbi:5-oxoprolinase subunit B family protein [Tautonia sociabilis]|uniref:5-oxoprolinase subunit B family protein n=1 Tax=Tautonia sociabilis TaxID=2080755 RepID=UPI001F2A149E|nr:allophanate hydrolase subunit 1 [Tautonia sociabilis]
MSRPDRGRTAPGFAPLGDRALMARFDREDEAAAWAEAIRSRRLPGVLDAVACFETVAVFADPDAVDPGALPERLLAIASPIGQGPIGPRTHRVPVLYDGKDLDEASRALGIEPGDLVRLHCEAVFVVRAIGFLPGFPYLGGLPEALTGLPRRQPPRTRVPAGSVAIAGSQSCIYPAESPGGWHLLGRTPLVIADLSSGFFPMVAGDLVRFEPIGPDRFDALRGLRLGEPDRGGDLIPLR